MWHFVQSLMWHYMWDSSFTYASFCHQAVNLHLWTGHKKSESQYMFLLELWEIPAMWIVGNTYIWDRRKFFSSLATSSKRDVIRFYPCYNAPYIEPLPINSVFKMTGGITSINVTLDHPRFFYINFLHWWYLNHLLVNWSVILITMIQEILSVW